MTTLKVLGKSYNSGCNLNLQLLICHTGYAYQGISLTEIGGIKCINYKIGLHSQKQPDRGGIIDWGTMICKTSCCCNQNITCTRVGYIYMGSQCYRTSCIDVGQYCIDGGHKNHIWCFGVI